MKKVITMLALSLSIAQASAQTPIAGEKANTWNENVPIAGEKPLTNERHVPNQPYGADRD